MSTTPQSASSLPPARTGPGRRALALALFLAGLVLAGAAIRSASQVTPLAPEQEITLLTDPVEIEMRRHDVLGTFATGSQKGDRRITVQSDGRILFTETGAPAGFGESSDAYQIARRGDGRCLATPASGLVDIRDIDTLVYFGDTYRRTE